MSDQGFNFNPPPRREAKKGFEPPPWERDQFEELARRREAEKPVEVAEATGEEQAPLGSLEPVLPLVAVTGEAASDITSVPTATAAGDESAEEDPRVEAMMIGLRQEEPPFGAEIWKASIAAGAVLVSVGAVLIVWGVFALVSARRAGLIGALGGGIMVAFGLGFASVGGWMAFRTLRQRGVL